MKKRVRLYKAQEGMQVQDPQQLQQMLIAQVQSDRAQGVPVEETVYNIYSNYQDMFNNPAEVQEFVTSVYESIAAQEQQVDQQMQGEQSENPDMEDMQDQIAAQAEAGMQTAQMGAQVGNPSYFTGIDAYVPPNYMDMMSNPAFAFGGQKSKYVKHKLDLAKKQMGGEEEPEASGPDEIGQNARNQKLKSFVNSLKTESTMANIKKQAEQEYDQMMMKQTGGQQDFTHYTHGNDDIFHDQMNYLVEAQYGGMTPKQQRQIQRSMSRVPFGAVPTTPVTSIDIRKSGMFGRPKEYTINFASPLQAIGAPGGAAAYGYGINQSTTRKTEGVKGTVTIPGTPAENKKEVAKAEESTGNTSTGGTGGTGGTGTGNTETIVVEEDNTIVETPKPAEASNYQYIPGRPFVYTKSADGKSWLYKKENDDKWSTVTNQDALALLNTGQSKSGQLVTLADKPGYYYRRRNDGSYVKFKGDPAKHYEGKAPIKSGDKPIIIKPGDKNYEYLDKNATWNLKPYIPKVASSKTETGQATQDLLNRMYPNTPVPKLTQDEKNKLSIEDALGYTSEEYNAWNDLPWYEQMFADDPRQRKSTEQNMPGYVQVGEDYGLMPTHFITTFPGAAMNLIEGAGTNPNLLNAGQRMLNAGQSMLGTGAQRAVLNPGAQRLLLNPGTDQYLLKAGQKMLNPPPGFQYRLPFAAGGNVMNPGMDMYGNLQRFVYGGGDDPSVPFISQADMNYTNSKDTSDAYFQDGGTSTEEEEITGYTVDPAGFSKAVNQVNPLYQSDARFQNLFPGYSVNPATKQQGQTQQMPFGYPMTYPGTGMFNSGSMMPWYAGSWNKVTKGPYGANGQSFNMPGVPGGAISKIDVTKSGLMGRPKKYSITYSNPNQLAPRTNTPGTTTPAAKPADTKSTSSVFSNTEGLSPLTRGKVALKEFTANRQTARGERKFGTPEEQAREFERANPMQPLPTKKVGRIEANPLQPMAAKTPGKVSMPQRNFVNSFNPFNQESYIQQEYGDIIPELKGYYDENVRDTTPEAAAQRVEAALARRNEALGFVDPSRLTDEGEGYYDPYGRSNIRPWQTDLNNIPDFDPLMSKEQKAANEMGMKRNPMMLAYGGIMQDGGTPIDQDERLQPMPTKTLADLKPLGQQMMMDSRQKIADEANFAPEEYTVDYKVKNAFNVNYPQAISAANAGINKLAAFLGRRQEEDFRPLTQEELVGTTARRQEGLYSEYGDFKPDKQANLRNSLYSKYGGSTIGDELDMTDEEIEEFLANGGELEFI